jgi:hypothetical protein
MMCSVSRNNFLLGKSYLKLAKPYTIDHGGRRRPTAAMVPHSQRRRIQQSANILGYCCMRWRREWGTMSAVVDHFGHKTSTGAVVLL